MISFLLDTNIPSELIRSRPEARITGWIDNQNEQSLFLSVVTIGELRKGFALLPTGRRRAFLEAWFNHERWGRIDAAAEGISCIIAGDVEQQTLKLAELRAEADHLERLADLYTSPAADAGRAGSGSEASRRANPTRTGKGKKSA